jgi:eukaryotic-like serine/threonine-protein kinase
MTPPQTLGIGPGAELRDGRYRLDRVLGTGGMASVWLGRDQRLDRPVAIKVLSDTLAGDPGYVERFRREARLAARLSHPNLVKVFDFEPEGRPALIMEYIEGGTLDEAARRPETAVETEALAAQLLGALEHIHGAGIVHRDVKPGNVLLDDDGRAMLTDFGIAQPEDATRITQTGQVIGTLAYMAPEVQEGERATPQSDLYSAGVVLRDHLDADSPESLRRLVDRLTEPDPGLRPPSAKRALAYLAGTRTGSSLATEPVAVRTEEMDALEPAGTGDPPERREPTDELRRPEPAARDKPPGPRREYAIELRHVLAGLALLAAVIAAIVVATSGGGSGDPASDQAGGGAAPAAEEPAPEDASADEPAAEAPASGVVPEPKPNADPAKGAAREQEAFSVLQSGDAEGAVKAYEKALAEFPLEARAPEAFGQYPSYAYALYSYADALLQAGRADEAVTVLEERLAFNDQRETVQALLDEARAAAGA